MTADFLYLRLHGDEELYKSGYGNEALRWWKSRIASWRKGAQPKDALTITDGKPRRGAKDVYVYFDNDIKVHAPFDAETLARMLAIKKARQNRRA